jgi:nucleoside-diphosphate-sugar epimerase
VIANDDNVMTRSSTELMAEFFPDVKFRTPVEGSQSLINIDKARRLLGWEPRHSWRNETNNQQNS